MIIVAGLHLLKAARAWLSAENSVALRSSSRRWPLKLSMKPFCMDGRGRWMDNVFIKRLWRSLKYECITLNAFETGSEAMAGIRRWIPYDNRTRPHSALGGRTPAEVHTACDGTNMAA